MLSVVICAVTCGAHHGAYSHKGTVLGGKKLEIVSCCSDRMMMPRQMTKTNKVFLVGLL